MAKFKKGDKVVLKKGFRALPYNYKDFNECDSYYIVDQHDSSAPFLLDTDGNRCYGREPELELYEPEPTLGNGVKDSAPSDSQGRTLGSWIKLHPEYSEEDYKLQTDWYSKLMGDYLKPRINNKTNMTSIKTRIKTLALTQPKKALVKAELMDIDGNWATAAKDYAREMMLAEYMETKDFKDTMKEVADDINKED